MLRNLNFVKVQGRETCFHKTNAKLAGYLFTASMAPLHFLDKIKLRRWLSAAAIVIKTITINRHGKTLSLFCTDILLPFLMTQKTYIHLYYPCLAHESLGSAVSHQAPSGISGLRTAV